MESNLMLGLGISFALAILFTVVVKGNLRSFIMFLVVFVAICTWASLLEVWVLILVLVGGLITIYLEFKILGNTPNQI
jgi:hypothetical protein